MPTTRVDRLRSSAGLVKVLSIVGALGLAACASDYAPEDGQPVDQARLDRDVTACEAQSAAKDPLAGTALGFLGGALWGAAEGAYAGAIAGDAGKGAIIGVGAGAVLGTIYGTVAGNGDVADARDACMRGRGYQVSERL